MAKRYRRIIMIITIVTSIITIVSVSWEFIIRMYLQYRFQITTDNNASSIGIIGGADGPTSIYLSGSPYSSIITIIFALLSALAIIFLVVTRKEKTKR